MLRDRVRSGTAAGGAEEAMQSGALVSDDVVNHMVEERLSRPDAAGGFVLDGYPRTLAQAEHLSEWLHERGVLEVVIHLAVDYNVVIARLTGRRECPRCGTLYNMATKPPRKNGVCDLDGEPLMIRDDDSSSVIGGRLDAYEVQTRPVLEYYRATGRRVVEVDASTATPDGVFQNIWQALNEAAAMQ
jgi:adenylate kinase